MTQFTDVFKDQKIMLGMLHLSGADRVREFALEEAKILAGEGFDGVIVENYFGTVFDVASVVSDLRDADLGIKIGVNVLGNDDIAFSLAQAYQLDFIQMDSVAGHLKPHADAAFEKVLSGRRSRTGAALLGGVRFKYQPVASGRSEAEDVRIGAERCDAIVVTSEGTGIETSTEKTERFRDAAPAGFPLIVGAGLTARNLAPQMANARGGIVGSWLKDGHVDAGVMSPQNVRAFMKEFLLTRDA